MIVFKQLFYKNFLSTGNAGITIQLDKSPTTLVTGVSGAGKSTFIDALCFVLYGKPFRDINKPGLVNSVNGKNLEVTVEFDTNGRTYKIVRGIKPNKFDIFCNGTLISQDAAVRDYQKVLEEQILQMSFKTFCQIVVLGSVDYTPFMQLPAAGRREVVEDILDIGVFSTMNMLLKQQMQETKDQQAEVDSDLKSLKEKAEGLKRLIEVLSTKKDELIADNKKLIEAVEKEIIEHGKTLSVNLEKITELKKRTSKLEQLKDASSELLKKVTLVSHEHSRLVQDRQFFEEHTSCPTCKQDITEDHRYKMVNDILVELESTEEKYNNYRQLRSETLKRIEELESCLDEFYKIQNEVTSLNTTISMLEMKKADYLEELNKLSTEQGDIEGPSKELKEVAKKILSLVETKKELAEKRLLQENASVLLRDSGIKTAIIREYLPIINKYLNKYLSDLQLDIEFTLDEQFNEVVKSRYRDEFAYGNFSTGEKTRIDVALMMCWRKIASLKNSASTNLLVVDEILSGSTLDSANLDIMLEMLNDLAREGINIFIIAHGDHLVDKTTSQIKFEKHGNFTVMV